MANPQPVQTSNTDRCLNWLGLLSHAAGQLIAPARDQSTCRRLFDLIAADLKLDVLVQHELVDGSLILVGEQGLSPIEAAVVSRVHLGEGIAGRVARDVSPIYFENLQDADEPWSEFERSVGLSAYACVPLKLDDHLVGTLGFGRRSISHFDEDELVFLRSVAAYVALAERHLSGQQALGTSEQRLRLAQDLAGIGSFDWDLLTGEGSGAGGCFELLGDDIAPTYSNILKLILPEDKDRFRGDVDAALHSGESFRSEFRIIRPDNGRISWLRAEGGIVRDEHGRATRMAGIVRDVTGRRDMQEREHLLMREVDHRAKNLLTVVQSIVQLTHAENIDEFVDAVSGRIQALGRAHSLLAASRWEGADLAVLVDEELAPFIQNNERIHVEGPPVKLRPAAAQSVALVLHELVTNAAKYGALSVPGGSIELNWSLHLDNGDRLLICWREVNGPRVVQPTRRGFGTTVIEASVRRQLGGLVHYDWRPDGLRCTISLPAKQLVTSSYEPLGREPAPISIQAARERRSRILVVEDEPLIALQIGQILEKLGYSVIGPAANIGEALELLQTGDFDFALLDVELGGSRSFPIADVLVEKEYPFAFMTGFTVAELPERFQGAPMLPKPLCAKEIQTVVQNVPSPRHRPPDDGLAGTPMPVMDYRHAQPAPPPG